MRILAALALFLLAAAGPARAERPLTPEAFREAVIAAIRALDPEAQITRRDPLSFSVGPEREMSVNLDNAYSEYLAAPETAPALIDRFARFALGQTLSDGVDARARVVIVLRTMAFIEAAARAGPDGGLALTWRPFAGDLVEILAIDSPETIEYPPPSRFEELGLTIEDAWRAAPENLPARLGELEMEPIGQSPIFIALSESGLAPSFLTFPDYCANPLNAGALALLLDRSSYLYSDAQVDGAEQAFAALAHRLIESGESLSHTAVRCAGGAWTVMDLAVRARQKL